MQKLHFSYNLFAQIIFPILILFSVFYFLTYFTFYFICILFYFFHLSLSVSVASSSSEEDTGWLTESILSTDSIFAPDTETLK